MFNRRTYLDYAAAAPKAKQALQAEHKAQACFANPGSIHADGVAARRVLETARTSLAKSLGAHADEIILCGSGTESDNLAVLGAFKYARLSPDFAGRSVHIITTAIEHPAVLEACRHIEAMGGEVTYLSVNEQGEIDIKELRAVLQPNTVLVSIAYANNEIGTIQPLREIRKEIAHFKKSQCSTIYPLFHTDACQAAAYLNLNVEQLGVDLLTLNGAKLGAGHGAALLYARRGTPITPMLYGGGQEKNLRSGTENVAGAAGLAAALKTAQEKREKESARLGELRDYFIQALQKEFPEARINGSLGERLPNNVHVSFQNIQSELIVLELDAKGISASAGSACSSAKDSGSHVLAAMYGAGDDKEWGSVRFSFGLKTSKGDIKKTLKVLGGIVEKYKKSRDSYAILD